MLEVFAWMGLTVLELGLGRYAEALGWGMRIYDDDPPGFGNRILPEIVEAGARSGDHARRARRARPAWLTARRPAARPGPWACWPGHVRCWPATADAETFYRQAIAHLTGTSVRTELARAHLLYGEWLRRQKRRRDARSQLRTAYDMFDAMGAAAFARRTRAELLAAGDSPHQPAERAGPDLTPQETQVCPPGRSRRDQRGDRHPSVRDHIHRRIPPQQGVPETRHHLPPPARDRPHALTPRPPCSGQLALLAGASRAHQYPAHPSAVRTDGQLTGVFPGFGG